MAQFSPRKLWSPASAGLIACLIGLAISLMIARLDIDRARASAETDVLARLALVQSQLSTVLRSTFSPTDSLVHLVSVQSGVSSEVFAAVSERLIEQTPTIRNLVIAPNDEIAMVYPIAGNEAALGLRYSDNPAQFATVQKARELRQPFLTGPVKLVQGGDGFIQRYPVFTVTPEKSERQYWGVISIVADVNSVLDASGVKTAAEINIAIINEQGAVVFGDPQRNGLSPVKLTMPTPGGAWTLLATPKQGWPSTSLWASHYLLLGLINSLLLGLLGWQLLRRQRALSRQNIILLSTIEAKDRSEASAQENQRLLNAIVDSAPALIYVFNRDERLLFCNRQFEKAVNNERDQIVGQLRSSFISAPVAMEHGENDRLVLNTGQTQTIEEIYPEADGIHTYLTLKSPLHDSTGKIIAVIGISTDITQRKQAERDLQLASTVYENTADGIVITNPAGTIISINRAFTEITGYSENEAVGENMRVLQSERQDAIFYKKMWATLAAAGVWQGEIWNRRKNGEPYPQWLTITTVHNAQGAISNFVGVFSDISAIKRSQAELEHLAHFDPLTDLPNRALFHDRLSHALERAYRYEHHIAVMLLDLDGFKIVNDSLGHPVGDQLLQQVAKRLKTCVRVEDTVSRLGGDEFAIVLSNLDASENIVDIAEKILLAIEQPFDIGGNTALVTTSIGIAISPDDGDQSDVLIRNADAAMYRAKESGRNTYRYYQPEMTHAAQKRLASEQALRLAIERREFEVWYQPQISFTTGQTLGAEALVRWRAPKHGLIPPVEFIPLAESTGLIVAIGEQVLRQVCHDARQWLDSGLNPGKLGINVSGPQLFRSDFVALLQQVISEYKLQPNSLEIEITETFVLENPQQAEQILNTIQAMGLSIALDDFGTGYSSLSHLKKLPIDTLKIDRGFISDLPDDPHDAAITRAILAMGRSLGFNVIAEGVENEIQHKFLIAEGCTEGQGYLFAKPMPAADFTRWLETTTISPPDFH